jgi:hypothetical protein
MFSFWIVEKFDVFEDLLPRFFAGFIGFSPDPFPFEKMEKAFCHGIVITISPGVILASRLWALKNFYHL